MPIWISNWVSATLWILNLYISFFFFYLLGCACPIDRSRIWLYQIYHRVPVERKVFLKSILQSRTDSKLFWAWANFSTYSFGNKPVSIIICATLKAFTQADSTKAKLLHFTMQFLNIAFSSFTTLICICHKLPPTQWVKKPARCTGGIFILFFHLSYVQSLCLESSKSFLLFLILPIWSISCSFLLENQNMVRAL